LLLVRCRKRLRQADKENPAADFDSSIEISASSDSFDKMDMKYAAQTNWLKNSAHFSKAVVSGTINR
jgi:hypothetical protein